ncbi:MAG: endonuclease domain-containing protein [Cryomorphaceae bacterium]
MPKSNSHYNKQLKEFARNLRKHSTQGEIILWKHILRASGTGVAFRRQRPIDRYIVDFICIELKLIIELDGETHVEKDDIARDKRRERRLRELGYHIMRFKNDEVFDHLKWVENEIKIKISELSSP